MQARKRVRVNIQLLRRAAELSQEELGALSDVNQTYLSQLEGGKRNPSVNVLERIANALKGDIAEFFRKTR
jgi:transcriptional regulator with XRE-family HTH domain